MTSWSGSHAASAPGEFCTHCCYAKPDLSQKAFAEVEVFDDVVEGYQALGDAIPHIEGSGELFLEHAKMQEVLVMIFKDLLELHTRAFRCMNHKCEGNSTLVISMAFNLLQPSRSFFEPCGARAQDPLNGLPSAFSNSETSLGVKLRYQMMIRRLVFGVTMSIGCIA